MPFLLEAKGSDPCAMSVRSVFKLMTADSDYAAQMP